MKKIQRYAEKLRRCDYLNSTYVSFESSATVEPRQRISNIYIYLFVCDQSVLFGGSEHNTTNRY